MLPDNFLAGSTSIIEIGSILESELHWLQQSFLDCPEQHRLGRVVIDFIAPVKERIE
jgi:hypothetical protein